MLNPNFSSLRENFQILKSIVGFFNHPVYMEKESKMGISYTDKDEIVLYIVAIKKNVPMKYLERKLP